MGPVRFRPSFCDEAARPASLRYDLPSLSARLAPALMHGFEVALIDLNCLTVPCVAVSPSYSCTYLGGGGLELREVNCYMFL